MEVFHMDHHNSLLKLQASLDGSGKKRKYDDGAQSESSQATSNLGDQQTKRPPGVKAAKGASGKRSIADDQAVAQFETMCSIKDKDLAIKEKDLAVKKKDLAVKERVSKMSLLDSLISKKETLSEAEEALKQKFLTEMLSN
ncbi:hypothetical protein Bca52824_035593 [Brassica carinata]|uniref:No apical meristem-associated C-terminal domain-containing protein n=1 Tax=Brassica carinata TaxID=52824 RepID=A0A8X7V479_BRACI|nr:hypothetical protein Bca52824_035593 [Brassica carinata]